MLKRVSSEKKIEFVITVLVSYGTHIKHKNQNQKQWLLCENTEIVLYWVDNLTWLSLNSSEH